MAHNLRCLWTVVTVPMHRDRQFTASSWDHDNLNGAQPAVLVDGGAEVAEGVDEDLGAHARGELQPGQQACRGVDRGGGWGGVVTRTVYLPSQI
jgi:hypothetical protein